MSQPTTDENDQIDPHRVFADLREGEEVYINDRVRPLTVISHEWDDQESGYWRVWLEGYGTEYETIADPGATHTLTLTTAGGRDIMVSEVTLGDGPAIVSDTRADEFLNKWDQEVR